MFGTIAHTEHAAQLAEPSSREAITRWKADIVLVGRLAKRDHAIAVFGITLVVLAIPIQHPCVGRLVYLVSVPANRREAARDQSLAQPLGSDGEICHDAEAPE